MDLDFPDLGALFTDVVNAVLDGVANLLQEFAAGFISGAGAMVQLFPEADPLGLDGATGIIKSYAWLDTWFPATELFALIGVVITVGSAIFTARVAYMAWKALPFT